MILSRGGGIMHWGEGFIIGGRALLAEDHFGSRD